MMHIHEISLSFRITYHFFSMLSCSNTSNKGLDEALRELKSPIYIFSKTFKNLNRLTSLFLRETSLSKRNGFAISYVV
jgi:hypothetical protein